MQYVITPDYRFWWAITVRKPDPVRAGEFAEFTLRMQFRALSRERIAEIVTGGATDASEVMRSTLIGVCCDWEGVLDEAQRPVPFGPDSFEAALDDPWFLRAAWAAYLDALGRDPKAGN